MSRHSVRAAARPRRKKRSRRRLNLVSANTVDHVLSLAVERAAVFGGQDAAHEGLGAAVPAGSWCFSTAGIGRDEYLGASGDDVLHLVKMPVAGVGEHRPKRVVDAGVAQLALGGLDHRLEVAEVGRGDHHLGGDRSAARW